MSYEIRYGTDTPEKYLNSSVGIWAAIILVASVICIFLLFEREDPKIFLPLTQETSQEALEGLRQELQEGEPFWDAFGGFCREIIEDEQTPS